MFTLHGFAEPLTSPAIDKEEVDFFNEIAHLMTVDSKSTALSPDNESLPAGYTYFGQFIAHDVTLRNHLQTGLPPALQLDSIYGFGPNISAHLYHYNLRGAKRRFNRVWFRICECPDQFGGTLLDVPRIKNTGLPIMADARNDENFLLSQLHVQFLHFHNKLAEKLANNHPDWQGLQLFYEARRRVIFYYHQLIVHDFLWKIAAKKILKEIKVYSLKDVKKAPNFRLIDDINKPPVLLEAFSKAAFRFGHSQVRNNYQLTKTLSNVPLFKSSAKPNLTGFQRDVGRNIDWSFFFRLDPSNKDLQFSHKIDQFLAKDLLSLPFYKNEEHNLIKRNLERGRGLNTEDLLTKTKIKPFNKAYKAANPSVCPLFKKDSELKKLLRQKKEPQKLPLWLYILFESEIECCGKSLGSLGSRIVAEQLIWILRQGGDWYQDLISKLDLSYNMVHFLQHKFSKDLLT